MIEIPAEKRKTITLTLTESCNLRCSYCYENNKSKRAMSLDLAKQIVQEEMTKDDGFEFVYIDFFGGEPFLEFDKIKSIVEFVEDSSFDKPHMMFATTNGTLIHGEIQEWLIKHLDTFKIGLSLDGTKAMHDINRSNSFDNIDLDFYIKYYQQQGVKMTISKETLPMLFEGVKFCHDKGLQCNCNLAFGIDWSDEENKLILERELKKLIDFYLCNPEIEPCSMLNMGIIQLGFDTCEDYTHKWCGTGTHMHTYDVEGNKYPCQFFMPISAGEDLAKKAKKIVFYHDVPSELLDPKCKDCPVKSACPTCYGANFVSTGNIYTKDINMCRLTKIILKARSFFKAKQWEMGQLQLNEIEEQALFRSIIKIQENLEID